MVQLTKDNELIYSKISL